jgi:putative ATP-binding cassette transporter
MNALRVMWHNATANWHKTRLQIQRTWALSLPFFQSDQKWMARLLLGTCVALNLGMVYMSVLFNDWNRVFYDALQNHNEAVFWKQLCVFAMLATAFIVVAVYRFYLTQLLEVRWRVWMTQDYLRRWLSGHVFYQMELQNQTASDNPDQRIQEDIQGFTSDTVSLSLGLLDASVTLLSFIGILWGLSGGFSFTVAETSYNIPGFMVWMALLYSVGGSLVGHFIGRSMAGLNFAQQRLEADFRHHLMRVREYSDAIALDRGGEVEQLSLKARFAKVLENFMQLLKVQKRYTWFNSGYGQAAVVFPMLVAAPRYFSGAIQLGELMQISSAFGQVQDALSWFINNYSRLASWQATTLRLTSFQEQMARVTEPHDVAEAEKADTAHLAVPQAPNLAMHGDGLHTQALNITLPDGKVLLANTALHIQAGDSVLIQGPSGCGKSTLLRVLAGVWPFAVDSATQQAAHIALPDGCVFMPQRPYFPEGTLRQALAYPAAQTHYSDEALRHALREALLPDLLDQLDTVSRWTQQLSGGEQQRLALARVLLKQPRWVFADEATSALDEASEQSLYQKLLHMVQAQNGALVSVAHRPAVGQYHHSTWRFDAAPQGNAAAFVLQMH